MGLYLYRHCYVSCCWACELLISVFVQLQLQIADGSRPYRSRYMPQYHRIQYFTGGRFHDVEDHVLLVKAARSTTRAQKRRFDLLVLYHGFQTSTYGSDPTVSCNQTPAPFFQLKRCFCFAPKQALKPWPVIARKDMPRVACAISDISYIKLPRHAS